jgi:hypothetical protein
MVLTCNPVNWFAPLSRVATACVNRSACRALFRKRIQASFSL